MLIRQKNMLISSVMALFITPLGLLIKSHSFSEVKYSEKSNSVYEEFFLSISYIVYGKAKVFHFGTSLIGPFRLRLSESLLRDSRSDSNPTHRPLGVYTATVSLNSLRLFVFK